MYHEAPNAGLATLGDAVQLPPCEHDGSPRIGTSGRCPRPSCSEGLGGRDRRKPLRRRAGRAGVGTSQPVAAVTTSGLTYWTGISLSRLSVWGPQRCASFIMLG